MTNEKMISFRYKDVVKIQSIENIGEEDEEVKPPGGILDKNETSVCNRNSFFSLLLSFIIGNTYPFQKLIARPIRKKIVLRPLVMLPNFTVDVQLSSIV
ncbi:MAG: hypothetical protein QXO75_09875 [Nitrososphaerota archaeon]